MAKFAAFLTCISAAAAHIVARDIYASLGPQLSKGAKIYSPSSPQWANETARWSTYSPPTFVNAVVPATQNDIVATVKYATANNISFLTQGGGHGFSTTLDLISEGIMINLQNFNYAIVDTPGKIRMGGGAKYGTLINSLYNAKVELPVGVSPCVGATGATIGGGVGRLQGLHGLMVDAIESFRIVLASGAVVNASATSYPDLFYGMKGAGQLFGVIVETVYKTYPQTNGGNMYNVEIYFKGSQLESVLSVLNSIISNTQPAELAIFLLFNPGPPTNVQINFVWAGPRSTGLKYSQMFNKTGPYIFNESIIAWNELPYKSNNGAFAGVTCDTGSRQNNYAVNAKSFDLPSWRTAFNQYTALQTKYPTSLYLPWLVEVFGKQGEDAVPANSSAYGMRGYDNIITTFAGSYKNDSLAAQVDSYLRQVRTELNATSGYGALRTYQNYAHGDEPLTAIYGFDGRVQKLQCLKAKYDPTHVFKAYHDVPSPAKGTC